MQLLRHVERATYFDRAAESVGDRFPELRLELTMLMATHLLNVMLLSLDGPVGQGGEHHEDQVHVDIPPRTYDPKMLGPDGVRFVDALRMLESARATTVRGYLADETYRVQAELRSLGWALVIGQEPGVGRTTVRVEQQQ